MAIFDPITLESLLAQAIHSDTIDEFAEALRYMLHWKRNQAATSGIVDQIATHQERGAVTSGTR